MTSPIQDPQGIELPHVPSPEEQAYIQRCGQAIDAGAEAAQEAATAGDSQKFLQFAQGVDQLTIALVALKNGGKPQSRGSGTLG